MKINMPGVNYNNSLFKNVQTKVNDNKEDKASNAQNKSNVLNMQKKSLVEKLQDQVASALDKKENIKNSDKLTVEEKKSQLLAIDDYLNGLEQQIQQAKIIEKQKEIDKIKEKEEEKAEKEEIKNKEIHGDTVKGGVIVAKSLTKLIEARNSIGNIHEFNASKGRLQVELSHMKTAKQESGSYNSKYVAKLNTAINGLATGANLELKKALASTKTSERIKGKEIEDQEKVEEEN